MAAHLRIVEVACHAGMDDFAAIHDVDAVGQQQQLAIAGEFVPLVDEVLVFGRIHAFEIVSGGKMADQRIGIDAGKLFLADGEIDDGNILRRDALIGTGP